MEKNPCGNRVLKTRFLVFTWSCLLLWNPPSCSDLPVLTILLLPLGSSLRLQFLKNLFVFNFFRISNLHCVLQIVFILYGNWVFKTRDLCGILVSNSASRKRVFKPRVLYGTQVSKTQDASLLKPFKCVLTYYILSPYYASPQISLENTFSKYAQTMPNKLKLGEI